MFNSGGNGHGQYGTGAYRGTTGSKPSPPPGLQPSSSDENVSLAALMDRFAPPPASAPLPAQPFSFALRVGTTPVAPSSAAQQPFSFRFGGGGATAGTAPSTPSSAPAYDPFAHLEPTATIVAPRPPTTSASATGSQPPQPPPIRAADALAAVMAKRRAEKAAAAATRAAQGRDAGPVMMVVPDPMVAVDGSGLDDSLAGDDRTLPAGAIMPPRRPHSAAAAAASTSSSLGGGSAQVSEYPLERPASAAPGTPGTPALGRSSLERGLGASAAGPRFHTPAATPMAMPLPGGGAPLVAARQDRFVMLQTPNTNSVYGPGQSTVQRPSGMPTHTAPQHRTSASAPTSMAAPASSAMDDENVTMAQQRAAATAMSATPIYQSTPVRAPPRSYVPMTRPSRLAMQPPITATPTSTAAQHHEHTDDEPMDLTVEEPPAVDRRDAVAVAAESTPPMSGSGESDAGSGSMGVLPAQQVQQHQHHHHHQQQQQYQQQHQHVSMSAPAPQPMATATTPTTAASDGKWIVVAGYRIRLFEALGKGGSSVVYRGSIEGSEDERSVAVKKVRYDSDDVNGESSSYLEEVKLLELLNKPDTVRGLPRCKSVLELYAHEVSPADGYLYIVMEMGDMDMAQMLTRRSKRREKVDLNFVRHHWGMMVECVREIHERLVIHADLKPANFLVTKGELKLIDFGIAKSANADTTKVDFSNQVGTLNYMSPEALGGTLGTFYKGAEVPGESAAAMRLNRKTDVWSLGCILYLMVYMRTPFQDLSTAAKMRKIPDPLTRVKYPQIRRGKCPLDADALVDMEWDAIPVSERNDYEPLGFVIPAMQNCLTHSPVDRFDVMELLNMPFLRPDKLAWRR